ncbi:mocs1 [Symbiodinium microadriaticum]|nr:mocs1 [Symbiodinium microadriaticum]
MVKSVGITSNGLVLKSQLDRLVEVMSAVYAALGRGLSVKLNCVVMRGLNDNEVASFVELTRELPLDVRFIELMPFDDNNWDASKMVPYFEILDSLADKVPILYTLLCLSSRIFQFFFQGYLIGKDDKSLRDPHDTTKWYRVFRSPASPPEPFPFPATENREGDEWRSDVALVDRTISSTVVHPEAAADGAMSYSGRVGFITSMSSHFCAGCNRLRVTADGKVKVCLFGADELDLLSSIRSGLSDEELVDFIGEAVRRKKQALGGHGTPAAIAVTQNRPMILIGG